jgi:mono/diheme cytochrome c family protein
MYVFLPVLVALFAAGGCTSSKSEKPKQTPVEKGRAVFAANCTACHNANPKLDGSVGPAIFGSSQELLERRILHTDYPPGYKPKRQTHVMPALPFLKDDIPALQAYLNNP